MAGVRPISHRLGGGGWIDFGRRHRRERLTTTPPITTDSSRAGALFAVGYLPIVPFLDVFGKAGVARLETDVPAPRAAALPGTTCSAETTIFRSNRTDNKFA